MSHGQLKTMSTSIFHAPSSSPSIQSSVQHTHQIDDDDVDDVQVLVRDPTLNIHHGPSHSGEQGASRERRRKHHKGKINNGYGAMYARSSNDDSKKVKWSSGTSDIKDYWSERTHKLEEQQDAVARREVDGLYQHLDLVRSSGCLPLPVALSHSHKT